MLDAHRFQPRGFLAGEMPFDPLQDESDLCLTVPRPVEAVFDESFPEFDVLRISTPGQDRSYSGQDARMGLPPDLIVKTGKYFIELIGRDETDESTDDLILDHANDRREFTCGESPRLQVVVTAEQEGVSRRDIEPFQGRKRFR
jgi:hypothetical protein